MTALLALFLAPPLFLTICFAIELLVGMQPQHTRPVSNNPTPSLRIIMPAHNEGKIIQASLGALIGNAIRPSDILVVADNCSDETAALSRQMGVSVIERTSQHKGKGFALGFARDHLRLTDQPSVVIIIDADCRTDFLSLEHLAAFCSAKNRPCQAANLLIAAPNSPPKVQISTFAFFVKNIVRQRALQRLVGRAHLLGTGMAFPWPLFERANLATSSVVEDLQLGIDLARTGSGPLFVEQSLVVSPAESEENTLAQRKRWEGGYLKTAVQAAPLEVRLAISRLSLGDVWAAINLLIPPVALLLALDLIGAAIGFTLWFISAASPVPLLCLIGSLTLVAILLFIVWVREGRRFVTARNLAAAAVYVLWKIPMYLRLTRPGSVIEWTRTRG